MIKDCTLLVNSCDDYEFLWDGFFSCLKDQWKEFDMPIVLNTESKKYSYLDLNILTFSLDKERKLSWSNRLLKTLKLIQTEYILFFLDDFWLNSRVDDLRFNKTLEWIKNDKNIASFSFYPTLPPNINSDKYDCFELRPRKCDYKFNCQVAVWRKELLMSYLRKHESPWEFELVGSKRAWRYKEEFYSIKEESKPIFSYQKGGVIHRGKWFGREINDYIKKYKLKIQVDERGYYDHHKKTFKKKTFIQRLLEPNLVLRIKKRIIKDIRKIMSLI